MIDAREHFRDPHFSPALRDLDATDERVYQAVTTTRGVRDLILAAALAVLAFRLAVPGPVAVAVGCSGGRHRAAWHRHRPGAPPGIGGRHRRRRAPRHRQARRAQGQAGHPVAAVCPPKENLIMTTTTGTRAPGCPRCQPGPCVIGPAATMADLSDGVRVRERYGPWPLTGTVKVIESGSELMVQWDPRKRDGMHIPSSAVLAEGLPGPGDVLLDEIELMDPEAAAVPLAAGVRAVREAIESGPCLVMLIGPAGSGKSTLAAQAAADGQVLSLDALRAAVSGDENNQDATAAAVARLHALAGELLRRLPAPSSTPPTWRPWPGSRSSSWPGCTRRPPSRPSWRRRYRHACSGTRNGQGQLPVPGGAAGCPSTWSGPSIMPACCCRRPRSPPRASRG